MSKKKNRHIRYESVAKIRVNFFQTYLNTF